MGFVVALIGIAVAIAGAVVQYAAAKKAAKYQKQQVELQKKQNRLDAQRRRRGRIRESIIARAQSEQGVIGAGAGGDSVASTAPNSAVSQGNRATTALNQNQAIGDKYANAQIGEINAGVQSSFGSFLSSLGGGITNASGTIGRVGQSLFA